VGLPKLWARMSNRQRIMSVVGLGMSSTLMFCCGGLGALAAIVGPTPSKSPTPPGSDTGLVTVPDERPTTPLTESPTPSPTKSPSPTAVPTTQAPPPVPTTKAAPPPPPVRTTTKAAPPPPPAGPPTHSGYIQGGEFCKVAEEGWIGYSASGKKYVCRDIDHNGHPHWVLP
jgi:hypothetical protein